MGDREGFVCWRGTRGRGCGGKVGEWIQSLPAESITDDRCSTNEVRITNRGVALALFGKKKEAAQTQDPSQDDPKAGAGQDAGQDDEGAVSLVDADPKKAAKFFEHAQAVHDSTNYEYAMQLWLNGIRLDPFNMKALESFLVTTASYLSSRGRKSPSKELASACSAKGDLGRYLQSLLQWGMKPREAVLGIRAADAAARLGVNEPAYWLAERAFALALQDKKPRKDMFLRLKDVFSAVGAFDQAVKAGETAVQLDPSDGQLAAEIRNLSAQATMSQSGFENAGKEGGFKGMVRDAELQRRLDESERIVKTEDALDRLVADAKKDFEAKPEDPYVTDIYTKRLLERGKAEDEELAFKILMEAFKNTKQFRFRQRAGDIRMRRARRKIVEIKDRMETSLDGDALAEELAKAQKALLDMEVQEYKARVEAYPTDLSLKYELGRRLFEQGHHEEAIALFQESQHDPKNRSKSMDYLGQSFLAIGWTTEAIDTFRGALEQHPDESDEMGMGLRYGLLTALQMMAEEERELDAAQEAEKLASSIAIQQINYRDIRTRRDTLKKLIAELKAAGTS